MSVGLQHFVTFRVLLERIFEKIANAQTNRDQLIADSASWHLFEDVRVGDR